jgi:hypothetical protein
VVRIITYRSAPNPSLPPSVLLVVSDGIDHLSIAHVANGTDKLLNVSAQGAKNVQHFRGPDPFSRHLTYCI